MAWVLQADMMLVAEDAVAEALKYVLTKEGKREVSAQKSVVKVL